MGARWPWHGDREVPHHDVGLQAERTAMAWQRTALGVGGVSALLLHQTGGSLLRALPGLFGLAMAIVLLVLTEVRYEHTVARIGAQLEPRGGTPAYALNSRLVLGLAVTVSLLSVMAVWLVLVQG